jgi:hypothetical protein
MTPWRRGPPPWRSLLGVALVLVMGAGAVRAGAGTRPAGAANTPPEAMVTTPQQTTPRGGGSTVAAGPARRPTGVPATLGCERCHGELELLRQQAGTLTRAQQLLVPERVVAASAHAALSCAECHGGYTRYPHEDRVTVTHTCSSCHAPADTLWRLSTHAAADDQVGCVQCHGSHDIRTAETLGSRHGAELANAPCRSCHQADRLAAHAPHADSVACASCHAPHDTRPVNDPASWLAPARQMLTCGACHDSVAQIWRTDIHGDAGLRQAHLDGREPAAADVVCTSCHIGHEMVATDDPRFALLSVERCSACHEHGARTFYNSYHGRATALGSSVSASCADCHGAHDVLPDTFPAARVSQAHLLETCRACHPNARPAFARYDAHPDPFNRARNPWLFYSFFLMNGLLAFVLVVFGGHTLLWWLRLWLDRRRGSGHGIGAHGQGPGKGHAHPHGQEAGGPA